MKRLTLFGITIDPTADFRSVSLYLDEDSQERSACPVCAGILRLHWWEVETDAMIAECLTCGATDYQPALEDDCW